MENLVLFALSVSLYVVLWAAFCDDKRLCHIAYIVLLCLPININGYVISVLGMAVGEKGVYSLYSPYQYAIEGHAFSLVGFGLQNAGGDAVSGIGIPLYMNAGRDATTFAGVPIYMNAGRDMETGLGVPLYMNAGRDAVTFAGVPIYMNAGRDAITSAGISFYQRAACGIAQTVLGLAILQSTGEGDEAVTRSFAVWSPLHAPTPCRETAPN